SIDELDAEPGWILVRDRCSVALIRRLISRQNADDLRRRVIGHIGAEQRPELSDIHIIHGPTQLDARMPNRDDISSGTMASRNCQNVKSLDVASCYENT